MRTLHQVLDITAEQYHADPCKSPSLSASIAHTLITTSPKHAWTQHPRLNPNFERVEDDKFDIGTVAHAMLLQGEDRVRVIYCDSWRTKEAKQLRDEAREQGLIPLLEKDYLRVVDMVAAARDQIAQHEAQPTLLAEGKAEQTLIWEEDGVTCRALVDWLRDDRAAIDDLKTTSRLAHPDAYGRALFNVGGDIQAAMYLRGARKLFGVTPEWRWIVVETAPPYALSVVSPAPSMLALADAKVEWAIAKWKECVDRNEWPAYPSRVCFVEAPGYEEARWLEREFQEQAA